MRAEGHRARPPGAFELPGADARLGAGWRARSLAEVGPLAWARRRELGVTRLLGRLLVGAVVLASSLFVLDARHAYWYAAGVLLLFLLKCSPHPRYSMVSVAPHFIFLHVLK